MVLAIPSHTSDHQPLKTEEEHLVAAHQDHKEIGLDFPVGESMIGQGSVQSLKSYLQAHRGVLPDSQTRMGVDQVASGSSRIPESISPRKPHPGKTEWCLPRNCRPKDTRSTQGSWRFTEDQVR